MGKLEKIEKFSAKGKVDKLFPFVHDADRQVCLAAIQALGKFTSQMDVMGALSQILDDGDTELRRAAAPRSAVPRAAMQRAFSCTGWSRKRTRVCRTLCGTHWPV